MSSRRSNGRTLGRRRFLRTALAVAVLGLAPRRLRAAPATVATSAAASATTTAPLSAGAALLGERQWALLGALAERLFPGSPSRPSAGKAGVMEYLETALTGAYSAHVESYRTTLSRLEAALGPARSSGPFPPEALDLALRQLEQSDPRAFALLRQHVLEGYLADPAHGGNRDHAGWTALGLVRHEH